MKKFFSIVSGCLLGSANGFFYFFGTYFVYEALTYSVELFFLAFIGFAVIFLLNLLFYRLIKKKFKPFALSFLILALLSDIVFLIVMSSIRYYT